MFLVQDTKGRKPKFHCLQNTRAVQELGKVWLDSTFVNGVYEELADSVESKNLAFQAFTKEMLAKTANFRRGKMKRLPSSVVSNLKKVVRLAPKMLDLNPLPVR